MAIGGYLLVGALMVGGSALAMLSIVAWWNRRQPGVRWFAVHTSLGAVWGFLLLGGTISNSSEPTIALGLAGDGLAVLVALSLFYFILDYLGHRSGTTLQKLAVLVIFGGGFFVLYGTSNVTGLLVTDVHVVEWAGFTIVDAQGTVAGIVLSGAGFVPLLVGFALLLRAAVVGDQLETMQAGILLVATVLPTIPGFLQAVQVTPSGFPGVLLVGVLTAVLYAYAMWRYDLFELVPATERIGIERAFDDLGAGVVITNGEGRILERNEMVTTILDEDPASLLGSQVATVFDSLGVSRDELPTLAEVDSQVYHIEESPITDDSGMTIGRATLLTEVTDRRRREQRIDVLNRVLRHNLRNSMMVIQTHVKTTADEVEDPELTDNLTLASETSSGLIRVAEKARAFEDALREETETRRVDVHAVVDSAVKAIRSKTARGTIHNSVDESLGIETNDRFLKLAIENLVENAIVHTDSEQPAVRIGAKSTADGIELTVADDGPGIDPGELRVLDGGRETALDHGSGLGLWIVKWSVDRLGGELEFESSADGTTVSVTVPDRTSLATATNRTPVDV